MSSVNLTVRFVSLLETFSDHCQTLLFGKIFNSFQSLEEVQIIKCSKLVVNK